MNLTCAILSFNHPEITSRCVKSVVRYFSDNGATANFHNIILVHNGSRPEHVSNLKMQWPQIQHLELTENRGYAGGANAALYAAFRRTEWCFFITNDCELIKVPLNIGRAPAFIAPRIHFRRLGRIDSLGGQVFTNIGHLRHLKTAEEFNSVPKKEIYVPGSAFLLHKDIFAAVGAFDESLNTYWEDVEYSLRVSEKQLPIQFTTDIELIHSVGKTCHKDSFYTAYLYHRNRARVCRQKTEWAHAYGLARAQLEFHFFFDFLKYSYRFASRRRWDDVKHLTRAYYGE
jgi:GT2 family glycosyltransferase